MVVRANILGTVVGPSGQDPTSRITVAFAWREDGKSNNLNVIASGLGFGRVAGVYGCWFWGVGHRVLKNLPSFGITNIDEDLR